MPTTSTSSPTSKSSPTNIPSAGGVEIGAPVTADRERRESGSAPAKKEHNFHFPASPRTKENTQTNYRASSKPDLFGATEYTEAAHKRAVRTTNAVDAPVSSSPPTQHGEGNGDRVRFAADALNEQAPSSSSPSAATQTDNSTRSLFAKVKDKVTPTKSK
ncbi:hypothetical protein LTR85_004290 [Meristemomyces frigidus]|nr:hypothetical protein LTR85_004290 [Meristemomyces frigidus]